MKVGLVQLAPVAGDPAANRDAAAEHIAAAAEAGADLVVLPELFTVGFFAFDAYADAAEPFEGPTLERCTDLAETHDIAILAGSFVEDLAATSSIETPAEAGLANTTALVGPDGEVRAWYRKRYLFGIGSEEATRLVAGERLGVGHLDGFTVGLTTCYDLRFPELYRDYLDAGVTLMLVPSAWPDARPAHWSVLTRARAIENQWYLVAVNGAGTVAGTRLLGRSVVYDPWGEPLVELGEGAAEELVEIDADRITEVRSSFPVLADRRAD